MTAVWGTNHQNMRFISRLNFASELEDRMLSGRSFHNLAPL